ncbi:MAG: HAD hydrolase-like protein, partial [Bryobacteraceae bacterium]
MTGTSNAGFDSILFDFDGVLADTEPVHWSCWAEVLRPEGIELDWDTYVRHGIGLADVDMLTFLAARPPAPRDVATLLVHF